MYLTLQQPTNLLKHLLVILRNALPYFLRVLIQRILQASSSSLERARLDPPFAVLILILESAVEMDDVSEYP